MNKVILIGNLGKAPETKTIQSVKQVCNFSLATNDRNDVSWHNITAWEKTADLCVKYLSKGSKVAIEGRLQYRTWENENGIKQRVTNIVADRVEFLDSKKSGSDFGNSESYSQPAPIQQEPKEDLPF